MQEEAGETEILDARRRPMPVGVRRHLPARLDRRGLALVEPAPETGNMGMLTVGLDGGGKVLAVFSLEEKAELFLHHEFSGKCWQVRETTIGELVSVLYGYGLCADAGKVVVLDPLPRDVCEGTNAS